MIIEQEKLMTVPLPTFVPHKWHLQELSNFDRAAKNGFKDKRFFLKCWHRKSRKTTLDINILNRECIRNPKSVYIHVFPTYAQAKRVVWDDPDMLKRYVPKWVIKRVDEKDLIVEYKNGSLYRLFGTDKNNKNHLRGVNFRGAVMDEFAEHDKSVFPEILQPIAANPNEDGSLKWVNFSFTPKGNNHAKVRFDIAHKDSMYTASILKASTSGIVSPEVLAQIRGEMPAATYEQEFECAFNEAGTSVFKGVQNAIGGELEQYVAKHTYVTGVDLARLKDYAVFITMCRETRRVVNFFRCNKQTWSVVKEAAMNIHKSYNSMFYVDATGVGDPIVEDFRNMRIPVEGLTLTNELKGQMINRLALAIEQRLITYPYIPELIAELEAYTFEILPSNKFRYNAPEGMHDDCVISLALAVEGMKNYITTMSIPAAIKKIRDYSEIKPVEQAVKGFDGWSNLA